MKVELISITEDPEKVIEIAARTCYDTRHKVYDKNRGKFLQKLMKAQHMSVFEHAWATFDISGISRACSHQLVRHRLASFSQRSQRYVREEGFEYVTPETIAKNEKAAEFYHELMKQLQQGYKHLLDMGIPKEDARFILPNACPTHIVMSANFREWLHILQLRLAKSAQWEIRELARRILTIFRREAPNIFGNLSLK
jgi:thymidylate synthase (FAD)